MATRERERERERERDQKLREIEFRYSDRLAHFVQNHIHPDESLWFIAEGAVAEHKWIPPFDWDLSCWIKWNTSSKSWWSSSQASAQDSNHTKQSRILCNKTHYVSNRWRICRTPCITTSSRVRNDRWDRCPREEECQATLQFRAKSHQSTCNCGMSKMGLHCEQDVSKVKRYNALLAAVAGWNNQAQNLKFLQNIRGVRHCWS